MDNHIFRSLRDIAQTELTFQALLERKPPLKTGFSQLDACMNGGITPELIVLGAGPGQGKTTFCLQLAEQVSRMENIPVLYFSLEMLQARMVAKTVAMDNFREQKRSGRTDAADPDNAKLFASSDLFNPETLKGMSEEKRRLYDEAMIRIAENENLCIIDRPYCAREIVEKVDNFLKLQAAEGGNGRKPLVIVDYLQILPPDPKGHNPATDKQQVDLNLKILRGLILKEVPVILISSLSRGNYSGKGTKTIKMDVFKETGGIEYSADVLMGLQFSACHNSKGCNPDEEKEKYPREMEIIILKQRYGKVARIPLLYYAQFDYMEEIRLDGEEKAEYSGEETSGAALYAESEGIEPEVQTPEEAVQQKVPVVYMNNTKVAYQIRNRQWSSGKMVRCNVAPAKAKPVFTEFTVTGELTSYDCEVADAVYTLYRRDPGGFTLRQLLHVLSGDTKQTLTDQKKKELEASLNRLRKAFVKITCTEEMVTMRKKAEFQTAQIVTFSGRFANIASEGGKYVFRKENRSDPMPLYQYGEHTTQMMAVPQALLCAREKNCRKIPDTAENITIKHYLIRRLEVIRKGKNRNRQLLQVNYFSQTIRERSGLLVMLGIQRDAFTEAEWVKKLDQTEKTVTGMLNGFKEVGYIPGYQTQTLSGITLPKNVKDPYECNKIFSE